MSSQRLGRRKRKRSPFRAMPAASLLSVAPAAGANFNVTQGTSPWVTSSILTWPGPAGLTNYGVSPSGTVPAVNASVTNGSFIPDNSYSTPLAVTNVSTAGGTALPTAIAPGSVVKIYNRGPSAIFYQLGTSSVVATTSNAQLSAGCWDSVIVKSGQTNIAALTVTSGLTATMNVESGVGLPAGSGCVLNPSNFQATGLAGVTWTNIGASDNASHTTVIQSTAPGTAATIDLLGIQGGGTAAAPVAIDVPTTGNNLYSALSAGTGTPGSAAPATGVMIGGTDGTNFRAMGVDSRGNQSTTPLSGWCGSVNC